MNGQLNSEVNYKRGYSSGRFLARLEELLSADVDIRQHRNRPKSVAVLV